MALDLIQQSFNAGVWSPRLDGRSDLEKYYSACRQSENMIPTRYGPAERRPGLQYVAEVKDSSKATRLLPFKFSTVQAYITEFGDEYIRFFKDRGQIVGGAGTEDISALDAQVAHWKMNEEEGTAVDDAVAVVPHDGTASTDTINLTTAGKVGTGCFDLDGQYNVTVPDDAALSFDDSGSKPFSIIGWGYVTQQANLQVLLSKWDETTGAVAKEWRLSLTNERKLQLHLADTSADLSGDVVAHWKLNDDAADTNLICSLPQYTIDDANAGANTFTITGDGDLSTSFPDGSEFTVEGSTGNDGQYTVVSTTFAGAPDFVITVAAVADGTDDGTIAPHAGVASANTEDFNATGRINGALNFGGAKYAEIDDSTELSFGDKTNDSAFSIAAWIYVTHTGVGQVIISKRDDAKKEYVFFLTSTRLLQFVTYDESAGKNATVHTDAALDLGWNFVVATYDGTGGNTASSGMELYIDNTAINTTKATQAGYVAMENDLGQKVIIGAQKVGGAIANEFAERMDNVIIFDKELTTADVSVLWNDGGGTEDLASAVASPFAITDAVISIGWHLFGATYDSAGGAAAAGGIILYVDGVAVDSTATNDAAYTAMQAGASLVRIGAQESTGGSAENFWGDKIDEMSLFSDVLTPTEMASLYSTAAYEISSPYLEADLFGIQRIQSADVMYGFHSGYNPRKLKRFEHDLWELEDIAFDWPPFMTENITETTITPSGTVGTIELTATNPIFTSDHVGSYWLIKHNRTDNKIEHDFGAAIGVSGILVDVKGPWRMRTSATWTGVVEIQRSYDGILTLVLDAPGPAGGAWAADDIITGAAGETCIIVSAIDSTHYTIKQLSGSFTLGEILTNQSGNARDTDPTYPQYTGWHTLETVQSTDDQNFNITGNEELGDAYLRVECTSADDAALPIVLSCERFYHYGIVKITGFTSATSVTGTTTRTIGATDATKLWSEGAWSDERGYPSCGTFHEERLMLGGTTFEPHNLKGSKTDEWENFRLGTLDDDSVKYSLAANEMNAIRWLISKEVLLMGTAGAEWKLGSFDAGEPLTPGNPTVPRVQTTYGSKDIQAIMLANIVLFVVGGQSETAEGRVVRGAQFVFEKGESGGYDAPDYTTLAEHITESGIVSMAYQQQPEPVLWCVLANGKAIGMTFEPGQKIWGWFPVITDGLFKDVAVIPGVSEDEVWWIVERTLPDGTVTKNIEYFKPRDWGADQKDCFFVDSGLSFDGGSAITITGISQADPCVVTAVAHGKSDGDQVRIRYVGGMGEVRNRVFTVDSPATDTFALRDELDTVDIDSTAFTTFVASITGDTTDDSYDITNVSVADIAALSLGAPITGTGIPDDTTITALNDDRFTMSAKATFTDTSVTITIAGEVEQVDNTFSGLDHLEGKMVSVLGDGTVHEDVVVSSGVVSLTDYFNKVHIGLPYASRLMPMKIELQTQAGTSRAKVKKIGDIIFSFYNSLGCTFGTTAGTETIPFRKVSDALGQAVPLFTGEKAQTFPGGYELNGDIFVEQKQPLPLTVRSIAVSLQLYG